MTWRNSIGKSDVVSQLIGGDKSLRVLFNRPRITIVAPLKIERERERESGEGEAVPRSALSSPYSEIAAVARSFRRDLLSPHIMGGRNLTAPLVLMLIAALFSQIWASDPVVFRFSANFPFSLNLRCRA